MYCLMINANIVFLIAKDFYFLLLSIFLGMLKHMYQKLEKKLVLVRLRDVGLMMSWQPCQILCVGT